MKCYGNDNEQKNKSTKMNANGNISNMQMRLSIPLLDPLMILQFHEKALQGFPSGEGIALFNFLLQVLCKPLLQPENGRRVRLLFQTSEIMLLGIFMTVRSQINSNLIVVKL